MTAHQSRALLTGATGFVGGRLAQLLVEQGWNVHVIVRPGSARKLLHETSLTVHVDDGVTPLHGIVAAAEPEVCFHLAGSFVGVHSDVDIQRFVVDNVLFGTRLADAFATEMGECYFVNTGSYWQNAGGREYHPVALYAATKQAFQDILQFYAESGRLRVANLKLFETYGRSDGRPKLLNLLLEAAAKATPIGLSDGRQLVDLVHVDDAAAACLAALRVIRAPSPRFQSYAVTSGRPLQLRKLVELVSEIVGREVPVEWGKREYRWREMMQHWDVAPLLPGWSPSIRIEEGIRAMWDGMRPVP